MASEDTRPPGPPEPPRVPGHLGTPSSVTIKAFCTVLGSLQILEDSGHVTSSEVKHRVIRDAERIGLRADDFDVDMTALRNVFVCRKHRRLVLNGCDDCRKEEDYP